MSPRRTAKKPVIPRLSAEQETPNRTPDDIPNTSTLPPQTPETVLPGGAAAAPLSRSDPPKVRGAAPLGEVPNPPQGEIQTRNPKGQSFGIAWSTINQYDELIARACAEFHVPFGRLKAIIPIESRGDPRAVQRNEG